MYVLDEPRIGLHQRDNQRLIATLQRLRDLGNTVLVVEHDEETIGAADHVVDFGPGAGRLGGKVVFSGTPGELDARTRVADRRSTCRAASASRCPAHAPHAAAAAIERRGRARAQPEGHRRRASRSACSWR